MAASWRLLRTVVAALSGVGLIWLAFFLSGRLLGQDDSTRVEGPLIDQQPFDLIALSPEAGGASVTVFPIPFPNRQLPTNPKPTERLEVVLVRFPEREYEVMWRDIESIKLYERRIYEEAKQRMEEKDFIAAFQNLSFLLKNYPHLPGLEELRQEFLLKSAADRYQAGELRQTLSALEELKTTAPGYQAATVTRVLSQVADSLIAAYQSSGDLGSAKVLLNRLQKQYGTALPVIGAWQDKLESLALLKRDEALALLEEKQYRRARRAALDMLSILPDVEQGAELLERINREHPMVRVGVMQRANSFDAASVVDWAARRAGLLVQSPLVRFLETGAEGGRYGFALGTFRLSDDRQQLILSLDASIEAGLDAFGLAQLLLSRADPHSEDYDPSWAAIFRAVSIQSSSQLLVQLRRPNVLPHALLQWSLSRGTRAEDNALPGFYRLESRDEKEAIFSLREAIKSSGQPQEIIEVYYDDPKQAVNDLLRGEIDVLDQLYPVDAQRLAIDPRVRIGAYALPTTHMLISVSSHPYMANPKFRRALLYATNRQGILQGELLDSDNPNDGRLISGPFPVGGGSSDPIAYAYNTAVLPVEYNPQLAKLLLVMVEQELHEVAKKSRQSPPEFKKLVVGCPDFEFARVAVQALLQQWAVVGIEAEMFILSDEDLQMTHCDLRYVTTTMWEPATDIERLLGGSGIVATDDPFIVQGLESLRLARNWREVRNALRDLHQLIDYHLPVMPLWQVTDRFAVNNYVEGLDGYPVSLYQDISAWRVNPGSVRRVEQ